MSYREEGHIPEVSILRCSNYRDDEVFEVVRESIDLVGGIKRFVKKGERILLKPNLLTGKPPEACATTHPSIVRALVRLVRDAGGIPFVGDSAGIGNMLKIAQRCGIMQVCEEMDVEFMGFTEPVRVINPRGTVFKRLEVAREVFGVDGIINLPKLKTHTQMFLTLGVKNLFGCVPGKFKPQWHLSAGVNTTYFASMLLDLYLFLKPRLTVMDGIMGMEGLGPGSGEPRYIGLVLASTNAIAMDRVIVDLLSARMDDMPVLKTAERWGLNGTDLHRIDIKGEGIEKVRIGDFRFPPLVSLNFAERLPYFIEKRLRKALTTRPHIDTHRCTLCGVCVDVCPAGVMEKKDSIVIDYSNCIRCYCCLEMCPHGSIDVKEGWLKRLVPGL